MTQNTKKRILIVQDKPTWEQLRQTLPFDDYELFAATSNDDAYNKVMRHAPDLAIVEAQLPGFDGVTFCRQIRQNGATNDLPLLMLSSKSELADKMAAYEAGIDDHVAKPFLPEELACRVTILIKRRHRRLESEQPPLHARGRIIALFGTKGGVGRTTIAVNLAVALQRRADAGVMLFDADFFFGDMALHLNLSPSRTIVDLVEHTDQLDLDLVEQVLIRHPSGIHVLVSPRGP